MEPGTGESSAQAELNRFREEWLSEVARNKIPGRGVGVGRFDEITPPRRETAASLPLAGPATGRKVDFSEDVEPRAYHDLPDKENTLTLGRDGEAQDRSNVMTEPSSALEHYEHAVEVSLVELYPATGSYRDNTSKVRH